MTDIQKLVHELNIELTDVMARDIRRVIDYLHSRGYLGGVPEWQPIETAPKGKHEIFYVSSKKYYPPYVGVNAAKDCPLKDEYPWRTHQSGNMIHKSIITHWMPLPTAPKGEMK